MLCYAGQFTNKEEGGYFGEKYHLTLPTGLLGPPMVSPSCSSTGFFNNNKLTSLECTCTSTKLVAFRKQVARHNRVLIYSPDPNFEIPPAPYNLPPPCPPIITYTPGRRRAWPALSRDKRRSLSEPFHLILASAPPGPPGGGRILSGRGEILGFACIFY